MSDSDASTAASREPSEAAHTRSSPSQVSSQESNASSLDEDYDSDTKPEILKQSLEECLDSVKSPGSFATSGVLPDPTLSGLYVQHVGSIGFPLQEAQAKAIIGASHRAPFGQGHRTIVDNSVRKTWELNPTQFELRNPKWPSVVQKVTEQVAKELGCIEAASVNAQLYKLLLYEKGAMFKPHQDTEKVPGMFGTLVIGLPSEYTGGAVLARHRRESKVFDNASAFDHTYIAWYADVTHEVKTVTSGHRLVLTYNLIDLSQGLQRSATMLLREKRVLKGIISSWARGVEKEAPEAPKFLAYKLDHEYTDASLKFHTLKGLDKVKAQYLQEVCAEAKTGFYLASMQRTVEGSCDDYGGYTRQQGYQSKGMHAIEYVTDKKTELKRMIDLQGSVLAKEIYVDEADIVQSNPYTRSPDKEQFGGYTGNEGASATHFYHDTVAVLVPFSSLTRFLSKHAQQGVVDTNSWYKRLLEKVQENPEDQAFRQELYHLAVLLSELPPRTVPTAQARRRSLGYPWHRKDYFPAPEAHWPIEASIMLEDISLFEMAMKSIKLLSIPIYHYIGKAIFLFDIPITHPQINDLVTRLPSFHKQYEAFMYIIASYEVEVEDATREGTLRPGDHIRPCHLMLWAEETYMHNLQSVDKVAREDGLEIADLATKQAGQKPIDEYIDIVKARRGSTAFSIAFASRLLSATGPDGVYSADDAFEPFLLEIINDTLLTFSVECRSVAKRRNSDSDSLPNSVDCLMSADDVSILLVQLDRRGHESEVSKMTSQLEVEAGTVDPVAFESFFLPLLQALIETVEWTFERLTIYGNLFRTTLSMYARRFVQIEPEAGGWTATPLGCGCSLCRELDDFLVNASQQSKRFPVAKRERQHLQERLQFTRISHVTDRGGVETLVVTKPHTPLLVKHEQWKKRFEKAHEQIRKLDPTVLKRLLGEDYQPLVRLRGTQRGDQEFLSTRVAGRRQGYEIIDLT